VIRILHTSDLRLGACFPELGLSGTRMRAALRDTLSNIIDACIQHRVHVLLIAGNLFDSSSVAPNTVAFVAEQFDRLAKTTRVVILPGDRDPYDSGSIYRIPPMDRPPPHVRILRDAVATVVFEEIDLSVMGRPITGPDSGSRPLQGFSRPDTTTHCVAAACGSVILPMKTATQDYPISPAEIEASGFEYVALGHWTSSFDFSRGSVRAFYSGSPAALSPDAKGAGGCLVVDLGVENVEGGIRVSRVMTGSISWTDLTLDTSGYRAPADLLGELIRHQGSGNIVRVRLIGAAKPDWAVDFREVMEQLESKFLHLQIDDETVLSPEALDSVDVVDTSVAGQFVRTVRARIAATEGDDSARWSEAALVGLRLLRLGGDREETSS
jgi:exonuclease SbcD